MAWRSQLPILAVGTLGVMTASVGLGYGLGQYTVTGMDPFISLARSPAPYRAQPLEAQADTRIAQVADDFGGIFDPDKWRY